MNNKKNFKRWSPIPRHLTPKEQKAWEEEMEWEQQEHKRHKKEGRYDSKPKKKITGWRTIRNLFKKGKL